jgi:hypothetical protein
VSISDEALELAIRTPFGIGCQGYCLIFLVFCIGSNAVGLEANKMKWGESINLPRQSIVIRRHQTIAGYRDLGSNGYEENVAILLIGTVSRARAVATEPRLERSLDNRRLTSIDLCIQAAVNLPLLTKI